MILLEQRSIIKVTVTTPGKFFVMRWKNKNGSEGISTYKGKRGNFTRFLKKIQAADAKSSPRSANNATYSNIVDEIVSGKDRDIYVWSSFLDQLPRNINK